MRRNAVVKNQGQNSVDKEFLEIVGNGKPTGSVLKETIAVSVTMSISVQKWHSRILLRDLLRSRMREMHREPEVPGERVPMVECLDGMQGLPQMNLHQFILWKVAPSRMLVLQDQEWLQIWRTCSYANRQVAEQPSKRSTKNGDKSALALLKSTRQFVCTFQDMEPPKSSSIFAEEAQTYENRSDVFNSLKRSYVMLTFETKIHRLEWFGQVILISATLMLQNLRIGLKKRRNGKSDVPVKQRGSWPIISKNYRRKIKQHSSHLRKIGACLRHQPVNQRKENLLWTPERRCTWSAKKNNSAELETLTTSKSLTTVITANGEVQTHEEATVYVKELERFLTMKVLEDTPAVLSLRKLCDEHGYSHEWTTGQKQHLIKNGIRIQCNTENFVPIVVAGLSTSSSSSLPSSTPMTPSRKEIDHPTSSSSSSTSPTMTSSSVSSESVARQERWEPCGIDSYPAAVSSTHVKRIERVTPCWPSQPKIQNRIKNVNDDQERWNPCHSDIPEWLQEFKENLVDDRVPERRDSHASSSHGLSLEPARSADLGKHSVYTHFPKDRNCEICQRTKITRAPCRRRIGGVVPRAENFGYLITADHTVLSEGCESWNNHRYEVVVQDWATQWIQSYPCKTKTSQETQRSLQKFLEPDRKPKVIYTDNSVEVGNACEDLSWNHCTSAPHRSETNGIAERAARRVKAGTSAILLQSGLDEKWWADSMECYTYLRKRHRFIVWWEDALWKTFWRTI